MDKGSGDKPPHKQLPPPSVPRWWRSTWAADPRSTAALIALTLAAEDDEDEQWDLINVLHRRGTPDVVAAAAELSLSVVARERRVAADILGQSGLPDERDTPQAVTVLLRMLAHEQDAVVLSSIATALGYRDDSRSVTPLLPLRKHPDPDVRLSVVHGLSRREDARAIAALIELSTDEDVDVRDWATFGLGSLTELDTPEICAALAARLDDADDDTRGEALTGLARRGDRRVIAPLLREGAVDDYCGGRLRSEAAVEAGNRLADPRLLPLLLGLARSNELSYLEDNLAQAIDRCARAGTKPLLKLARKQGT